MVDVAVISGSASDDTVARQAIAVLEAQGLSHDYRILSAHRDPDALEAYVRGSDARVFVCIAGLSAALPGVVASRTDRPVIGVPVAGTLGGLDALLSIAQMPKGVPVACVGIDNGENSAWLAVRILAVPSR